jgi:hypothetical protein
MTSRSDTTSDRPHLRLVTPAPAAIQITLTAQQMYALRDAALTEVADIDEHDHQWTGHMARRQQRVRSVLMASIDALERTLTASGRDPSDHDRTAPA